MCVCLKIHSYYTCYMFIPYRQTISTPPLFGCIAGKAQPRSRGRQRPGAWVLAHGFSWIMKIPICTIYYYIIKYYKYIYNIYIY
jgi:hypothetical protein